MDSMESVVDKKETKDNESGSPSSTQVCDEITLEYVSGVSSASKNAIALNRANGNVAFIASSVLALFDPRFSHQAFIENPSSREIRSVTYSEDGRFLAFGENGVNPAVSVYNAKQFTHINRFQVEERKCAIKSLRFHPRSIYLALLLAHDYSILVYEFVHGRKLAAARWCVEPLAMTMTKTENILAVCGHRKISCFSLSNVESTRYETNAMLDKKAVLLGKQGNYTFVDITSGQGTHIKSLYTVTSCGFLCEIQTGGIFINHVVRIGERCFCICFELGMLFVGCDRGVVSLCNPTDLTVIASVSDHDMFGTDKLHPMHWDVKSDIIALVVNPKTKIVTTLMSDQKMHSWLVEFGKDAVECSPVITSDDETKQCPMSKVITSHDMQCTLAQLLFQLELRNNRREEAASFLQRPSSFRNNKINAIKIAPDGKDIVVGTKEGEIKIYEATTGRLTRVIEAHSAEVTFIDMMYDNDFKLVATGGRDRLLFILDAAKSYKHVQTISDHSSAIVSISLAHNKGVLTLISSSADGVILIRRAGKEGKPIFNIVGELPEFVGCKKRVYNHSSGYIITGQERGRINVFPADPKINLKPMRKLQVGSALLKTVTIDPTGSFFIACSKEGQYVFHLQSGQQIATLCTIPGFHHLSFSQDLNYFINSNDAGCKFLWRLPSKVVDVMKAKMSETSNSVNDANTCEFFHNSYETYYRVCQQLVKQEQASPSINLSQYESVSEHKHSYGDSKALGNLLDDRLRLVDSESFTSCTTFSRSLTDLTAPIDVSGGFQKRHHSLTTNLRRNDSECAESISQIFNSSGTFPNLDHDENDVKVTASKNLSSNEKYGKDGDENASPPLMGGISHTTNCGIVSPLSQRPFVLDSSPTNLPCRQKFPLKSSDPLNSKSSGSESKHRLPSIGQISESQYSTDEPNLMCGFQSNKACTFPIKRGLSGLEASSCNVETQFIKNPGLDNCTNDDALDEPSEWCTPEQSPVPSERVNTQDIEYPTTPSGKICSAQCLPLPPSSDELSDTDQTIKTEKSVESKPENNNPNAVSGLTVNDRYKTIQLSNCQETYVLKNIDALQSDVSSTTIEQQSEPIAAMSPRIRLSAESLHSAQQQQANRQSSRNNITQQQKQDQHTHPQQPHHEPQTKHQQQQQLQQTRQSENPQSPKHTVINPGPSHTPRQQQTQPSSPTHDQPIKQALRQQLQYSPEHIHQKQQPQLRQQMYNQQQKQQQELQQQASSAQSQYPQQQSSQQIQQPILHQEAEVTKQKRDKSPKSKHVLDSSFPKLKNTDILLASQQTRTGSFNTQPVMAAHDVNLFSSMSNVDAGESEVYCQDFYLRKVLLSWALKKLHKERMKRKHKTLAQEKNLQAAAAGKGGNSTAPIFASSSAETSTASQLTTTSDTSDVTDNSTATIVVSSNTTLNDQDDHEPLLEQFTKPTTPNRKEIPKCSPMGAPMLGPVGVKSKRPSPSIKSTAFAVEAASVNVRQERQPSTSQSPIVTHQLSPLRLNTINRINFHKNSRSPSSLTSPTSTLQPKQHKSVLTSPRSSEGTHAESDAETTSGEGSNGAMVDLFRNQDNYLRKLREVRRNFEKSIQALSAERESQRLEAQKYFGRSSQFTPDN